MGTKQISTKWNPAKLIWRTLEPMHKKTFHRCCGFWLNLQKFCYKKFKESCNLLGQDHNHFKPMHSQTYSKILPFLEDDHQLQVLPRNFPYSCYCGEPTPVQSDHFQLVLRMVVLCRFGYILISCFYKCAPTAPASKEPN